jgi:hypothetical protein
LRSPLGFEPFVSFDWAEKACREWGIDAFEKLQEDEADRVPLREELIASRVGDLGDEAFGAEFREIIETGLPPAGSRQLRLAPS